MEVKHRYTAEILLTVNDLRGANLTEADLRGADLYEANLRGADLRGADLTEGNLTEANLYGANLYGANLRGANLRGADLGEIIGSIKNNPIIIQGFKYNVIIWDNHAKIGCQVKTFKEWLICEDYEQFNPMKEAFKAIILASGRQICVDTETKNVLEKMQSLE